MKSFSVMCCQVQLFPMDNVENLRILRRGDNRFGLSNCYHPQKYQHNDSAQNSGHNNRIDEFCGKQKPNKPS